jgi:hypothetical protein
MGRRDKDSKTAAKIWMSVFLAFVMVFSVFGIMLNSQSNEIRYGKFKFTVDNDHNYYVMKVNGQQVYFYTLPGETSYLNVSNSTAEGLKSAVFIVTTFDPLTANDSIQAIEVARFDFATLLKDKQVFNAVTRLSDQYSTLPVIGCENATQEQPVIMFNISDIPSLVKSGNCIYLNGRGNDFLRLRDAMLYSYFGVFNG